MKIFCLSLIIACVAIGNSQIVAQENYYKTKTEIEKEYQEKLKILNHKLAISLQYGHFELLQFAKADDNTTDIDISNYHNMFNLVLEYYLYERLTAQLSIGLILIPQEQKIDSVTFKPGSGLGGIQAKGSGKGGALLPITFGAKATFLEGLFRPYISILSGFTFIKVGMGAGSGSIYGIEKNIDYRSKFLFSFQLGSGFQLRVGKVVRLDLGVNYYGSSKFTPSIGGINSYYGLYFFGGMNFILNPK